MDTFMKVWTGIWENESETTNKKHGIKNQKKYQRENHKNGRIKDH